MLEFYEIVVSIFSMLDKDGREKFFEESFWLAHVKPDVVLGMPFLTISNADIDFQAWDLQWRSYSTGNVLPTTRRVKLIEKTEFAVAAFDLEHKVFLVHIAALSVDWSDEVYPSIKAPIAQLKVDKAFIKVPSEYTDYADVFLPKLATEFPKHMEINNYAIELVDDW